MEREIICIVCPRGCHINVKEINGELEFSNYSCNRGPAYVQKELVEPMRMLTTTVAIEGAIVTRLPVVSSGDIPKQKIMECIKKLANVKVYAPIKVGDIIYSNILGLGVDIVATKTLDNYLGI